MIVLTTPRFDRAIKKISPPEKKAIDQVIREIVSNPQKGEMKKGELASSSFITNKCSWLIQSA